MPPSHRQLLHRLRTLSTHVLARWPLEVKHFKLINHGENTIYDVHDTCGERYILRLHRPNYQSNDAIRSELSWLKALQRDTDLRVPHALAADDGDTLQECHTDDLPEGRRCVLFTRQPGSLVGKGLSLPTSRQLGELLAKLHLHAKNYCPEEGIARAVLHEEGWIGPQGIFGDPLKVPNLSKKAQTAFSEARDRLGEELRAYGQDRARFGLVHSDLHMHNVLRYRGELIPIDFDDCAMGYYMQDLVIALRSMSKRPNYQALKKALVEGYTQVRPLEGEHLERLPALTAMSMMVGVAWVHDRSDIPGMGAWLPKTIEEATLACERYLQGQDPLDLAVG